MIGLSLSRANELQVAMQNFVTEMLHASPVAQRMHVLWQEYEAQETPEARFVKGKYAQYGCLHIYIPKDLDRLEVSLQGNKFSPFAMRMLTSTQSAGI